MGGSGWARWSGVRGEWDNCNSIINKYIFKKDFFNYEKKEENKDEQNTVFALGELKFK